MSCAIHTWITSGCMAAVLALLFIANQRDKRWEREMAEMQRCYRCDRPTTFAETAAYMVNPAGVMRRVCCDCEATLPTMYDIEREVLNARHRRENPDAC